MGEGEVAVGEGFELGEEGSADAAGTDDGDVDLAGGHFWVVGFW